jgi:hypothetical protein
MDQFFVDLRCRRHDGLRFVRIFRHKVLRLDQRAQEALDRLRVVADEIL